MTTITTVSIVTAQGPPILKTTTVISTPTSSSVSSEPAAVGHKANDVGVPVAAIAGGAAAGIVLAVAAVVLWHLWGRSIKRKETEKRKQAVSGPEAVSARASVVNAGMCDSSHSFSSERIRDGMRRLQRATTIATVPSRSRLTVNAG